MFIAAFPTFTQVLPGFEQAIGGLRASLLPLMSVLMIASLVGVAKEGHRAITFQIITLVVLVGLAANWDPWFKQASTAVAATFTGDRFDLAKQSERYLVKLKVKAEQKDADEGYVEAFFRAIMAGALLLFGYVTKGVILLFLILQQVLLVFAYALSPLFLGLFSLRSTRNIGLNYVMTTVGLVSWPLGFALSACGTFGLVEFFTKAGYFALGPNVLVLNEAFFALLIIAVWMLTSTIIAPVIISKVVATGAQAGSALLAGAATTTAAAGAAAVSAGTALATGGATAAAGGAGVALGGGGPAAAGAGASSGSSSSGLGQALRAAGGATLGGGASLLDAAMSGGGGYGPMSGASSSLLNSQLRPYSSPSTANGRTGGGETEASGEGDSAKGEIGAKDSSGSGGGGTNPARSDDASTVKTIALPQTAHNAGAAATASGSNNAASAAGLPSAEGGRSASGTPSSSAGGPVTTKAANVTLDADVERAIADDSFPARRPARNLSGNPAQP